jgi:hypothetical protein
MPIICQLYQAKIPTASASLHAPSTLFWSEEDSVEFGAAKISGIDRSDLHRKIKKFGMKN